MFTRTQIENMLFLDIECVSGVSEMSELSPRMQALWEKKSEAIQRREEVRVESDVLWRDQAAIHAEFGRVITISCGYVKFVGGQPTFKVKSYFGHDEKEILRDFAKALRDFSAVKPALTLCAHNGKEFDFPYLGRRYVINQMQVPELLAVQGKKPWETRFIDTMELWKFGSYRGSISLDLLCAVLDVPSPKDGIDGSEVGRVYWKENDLQRIADYCERDVEATAQVVLRLSRESLIQTSLF